MQRKLKGLLPILVCAVGLLLSPNAWSAPDAEFAAFWTKFQSAVKKNDRYAVANLTKLPYMLESKNLNRQQFIQKYDSVFTPSVRKSLLKEKPLRDKDSYMVFCGEEIFVFTKVKGKYLFTEIGAND